MVVGPSRQSDSQDTERLYPSIMFTQLYGGYRTRNPASKAFSAYQEAQQPPKGISFTPSPTWGKHGRQGWESECVGVTLMQSSTEHLGFPPIFYITLNLCAQGCMPTLSSLHPDDVSQIRDFTDTTVLICPNSVVSTKQYWDRRLSLRSPRPEGNP